MEVFSMSDELLVRSRIQNYSVQFVNDVFQILLEEKGKPSFLIVDSVVHSLFREKFDGVIDPDRHLLLEANELHKTYEYCGTIIQQLLKKNVRKNVKIVAIGGGVVQDVAAFCASIMFRGLEWVFVPTTLLAQADSCIGGKTSINFGEVKNTIGNFYPPSVIHIDLRFLDALPEDDIKSGIGEILHFYYYANSRFIGELYAEYAKLLADRSLLKPHILESLSIKKSVIEVDEFDKGERNKFNFGHTFGHALESVTNYGIKHGQAVTVGMDIANMISYNSGLLDRRTYQELKSQLKTNFPSYQLSGIDIDTYVKFLSKDKKNVDEQLVCILSEGPGKLTKKKIPMDASFKELIASYFRNA
jgi:3-dehydroquinate synthase